MYRNIMMGDEAVMLNGVKVTEINVAVRDLDKAVADYEKMGFEEVHRGGSSVPPVQSRFSNLSFGDDCLLTLMESTDPGSPIDRFIQKRGEGLFSITLMVPDLDEIQEKLKAAGVELVLDKPLEAENGIIFAMDYKKLRANYAKPTGPTHGVVIELDELQR